MLGQIISERGEMYNVIILAGGFGSRMGSASEHLPKALSKLGSQRAIDLQINKMLLVAKRYIIGTGWQADLLESYLRGRYPNDLLRFSNEAPQTLRSNAQSLLYALDEADSRYGCIISFCDLLLLSTPILSGSSLYLATPETRGIVGSFRHSVEAHAGKVERIIAHEAPKSVTEAGNGILGFFCLSNTILLKKIVYELAYAGTLGDITSDILTRYHAQEPLRCEEAGAVLEFGTESDLVRAREYWEST